MADDMACAHPHYNEGQTKLALKDAEAGWFVRVDHIKGYGTDPHLERLVINPDRPLVFLNHYIIARRPVPALGAHRGRPGQAVSRTRA